MEIVFLPRSLAVKMRRLVSTYFYLEAKLANAGFLNFLIKLTDSTLARDPSYKPFMNLLGSLGNQ